MKIILNLFVFLTILNVTAQSNFDSPSFEVSIGDLETNEYPKDSTANALVIYEYGNSLIHKKTFDLNTEIKRKIKIFSKDKADGNATIEILLYKSDKKYRKEKIKNITATTYNLENNFIVSTKLNKSEIFEEEYDKNHTVIKFTMPKVKDGSVITYSYTLESPFLYKYKGWTFQEDIPVLYSEYNTSIPAYYEYSIKLVGALKLSENKSELKRNCLIVGNGGSADCTITKYVMKDIPAFIEEDFMTTKDNYLSRIEYELKILTRTDGSKDNITKTWKTVDKELKDNINIGKQLNKTSLVKDLLDSSVINETSPLKKAQAIYGFVQNTYTWNNEHKLFKKVSVKNLIKNKSGKASEINILLHNFLKANGIKVKPVLLSTRKNGFATKLFPVIYDFNYLIIETNIGGKLYYLDATNEYLSFGEIPFKCLNRYGRLLDFKNGSQWVDIKANKTSTSLHKIKLRFDKDQEVTGQIKSRYTGYNALSKKRAYYLKPDNYIDAMESSSVNINIIEHNIESKGKRDFKFQENYTIELTDNDLVGDLIYFDPFIFKFFKENPFKLQERTYPIDFGYKKSYLYDFELDLNNQYVVKNIPKTSNVKLPNNAGDFGFSTKVLGNQLTLLLKININKPIYSAEEYESLKEFMNRIVDIQTKTLIVLKKK